MSGLTSFTSPLTALVVGASRGIGLRFVRHLIEEDGEAINGSLLIIDFPDRAAAEAWLAEAPFIKGGVFGEARIYPYKQNWPRG